MMNPPPTMLFDTILRMKRALYPFCLILFLLISVFYFPLQGRTEAHPLSVSYSDLTLDGEVMIWQYRIDDLSVMENLSIDQNGDQRLDEEEVEGTKMEIGEWISQNLSLSVGGVTQRGMTDRAEIKEQGDKRFVSVTFRYPSITKGEVSVKDSFYRTGISKTSYTHFLTLHIGDQTSETILKGENREYVFSYTGTANGGEKNHSSRLSFLLLGMEHILTGYDHLLFLLSLLLLKQGMKRYIFIATAFTIAHSITLTMAVLGWVSLPSRLVEVLIAASIAFVAAENLWAKEVKFRWVLTFFFGLIHGLGFASILQGMRIPKGDLLISLFSFNLGIELIQVLLILLILPLLVLWQKSELYRKGLIVSSGAIALTALFLITVRLFA